MLQMRFKLLIGGIVLILAVGYLAFAGFKDGWVYHVPVSEFVTKTDLTGRRVRIAGQVSPEGLDAQPAKMLARFNLRDPEGKTPKTIPVSYKGTIPELFKAQGDVVVEGKLDATGVFQADVLMTKCASKYEEDKHAKRREERAQSEQGKQVQ